LVQLQTLTDKKIDIVTAKTNAKLKELQSA